MFFKTFSLSKRALFFCYGTPEYARGRISRRTERAPKTWGKKSPISLSGGRRNAIFPPILDHFSWNFPQKVVIFLRKRRFFSNFFLPPPGGWRNPQKLGKIFTPHFSHPPGDAKRRHIWQVKRAKKRLHVGLRVALHVNI